jgi:hypothetical protein
MPLKTDWPCWEIMKCSPENSSQCPAYRSSKPCWEIMREIDAYSSHICSDCIVYLIKQKSPIFSREEILKIMHCKGVNIESSQCPHLQQADASPVTRNN